MYKKDRLRQLGLADFNQPVGLKMNPESRWIKKAAIIPWDEIEDRYADLFPTIIPMIIRQTAESERIRRQKPNATTAITAH